MTADNENANTSQKLLLENTTCLSIDSTNRWILVSLTKQQNHYCECLESPRAGFTLLPKLIQQLCKQADINKPDWILTAIGPGSFTGIRLSLSYARNLSQLWGIPSIGIVSLRFYCYDILRKHKHLDKVAVMIDGKQGRVYAGRLDRQKQEASDFELADMAPHTFLDTLPKSYSVFVDDLQTIVNYIPKQETTTQLSERLKNIRTMTIPQPRHLYELGLNDMLKTLSPSTNKLPLRQKDKNWVTLLPLYLRADPANASSKHVSFLKTIT